MPRADPDAEPSADAPDGDNAAEAVIGVYTDVMRGQLAKIRLQDQGIRSHLLDSEMVAMDPLIWPALGGVRLVVAGRDAARAAAVLADDLVIPGEEPTCPECGAAKIETKRAGRIMAFISILLIGLPIGRSRNKLRCQVCGHSWRA